MWGALSEERMDVLFTIAAGASAFIHEFVVNNR
jgi:hypothetical protein